MWTCRNRACNTGNYPEDSYCVLCHEARYSKWEQKVLRGLEQSKAGMTKTLAEFRKGGYIYVKSAEGNGVVGYGHLKEAKELAIASVKRAANLRRRSG